MKRVHSARETTVTMWTEPFGWIHHVFCLFVLVFFAASESVVEAGVFHDAFPLLISFRWNTPLGRSARKED